MSQENENQVVGIGLDFEAREFMEFLEHEAVAAYREGFQCGKKAEIEKRRCFWLKVRREASVWLWAAVVGFALTLAAAYFAGGGR